MQIEELLAAGFREWNIALHEKYDRLWSYCRRDQTGERFHLFVRLWEFSRYS